MSSARRDLILGAAAGLFREGGFHGVGMDEIGEAAGITGPGVYRHFANKQAVLAALFDQVGEELVRGGRTAVAAPASPRAQLERLVGFHLGFALDHPDGVAVWAGEGHHLADGDRRSVRRRQRLYASLWVPVVAVLRPDLHAKEVQAAVTLAIGVLQAAALDSDSGLGRAGLERLVPRMVLGALLARRLPR
ncbi:MAG: TetR/AcrR family transcriptional regulator [Actinomycetota bacterium]|nr:TetR/AcrR family transcriptional regulator [Actinomycetota bacterium]